MNVVIGYDGTLHAQQALRYGIHKVRAAGGSLTAVHVFNRSMFVGYDAVPDAEEKARQEARAHLEQAKAILTQSGEGIEADVVFSEGSPEEELVSRSAGADLLVVSPRYRSVVRNARCSVSVVPGSIIVPVDTFENFSRVSRFVSAEAKSSGSKVLVLGIVPVNLYSASEQSELDAVRKEVSSALGRAIADLRADGVDCEEQVRSGYPDDEIAKAAAKLAVTSVVIPASAAVPSELGKAGAILSEDENFGSQVVVFGAGL